MRALVEDVEAARRADDWQATRDAVDRAGSALRTTPQTDPAVDALAAQLEALAPHTKWQVRKAVAHATEHLRRDVADTILAKLAADTNSFVRDAAQRSRARRAEAASSGLLEQQHADRMQKSLADLERAHGAPARRAALRVGKEYAELLLGEAHHEIVRVASAQDLALENLERVLGRDAIDRDAALGHTHRARERGVHLLALFKSIRELATVGSAEATREDVHVIVAEAVGLVVDSLRKDRPALADRLDVSVRVDRALAIDTYRHRLLLALRNVIHNAAEAYDGLEGAARVAVVAETTGRTVVITVTDEGCGMGEEAAEAFDLFATTKPHGTGIGLALVQSVVESEHAGSVRIASAKGKGTTVTIVLPIEQAKR